MASGEYRSSLPVEDDKSVEVLGGPWSAVGLAKVGDVEGSTYEADSTTVFESEDGHDIKYKTLTWQKTAALLFCEYIWYVPLIAAFVVLGEG